MKVLLAVSGGIDSMTMADIMFSHSCLYEGLAIAHCNFHLRPGDCDLDEQLVEEWSRAHALAFYRKDFDTEAYAHEHGISIEMAARELRYAWFMQLCAEHGFDTLAVAHNANDNAETLLLNLVRGTGLRGLSGMSANSMRENAGSKVALLRPLLGMTRSEIEAYAAEHNVPYRTDKTNLECEYKRNKIRNQVMPLLEEMNPSVVRTLNRNMDHFSAASAILDDWCAEHRSEVMDGNRIIVSRLLATKHWDYLLFSILDGYGFTSSAIGDVCRLLRDGGTFSGKMFHAPACTLVTSADALLIQEKQDAALCAAADVAVAKLDYVPGMDLRCERGVILYDADKVPSDAVIRPWRAGDWFVPFGMKGRKKLSDYFIDLHLSLPEKAAVLVLAPAEGEHVYAVIGYRIDDSIRVTPSTRTIVKLSQN